MFREYTTLVEENVNEGVNRGIQMFLENLNEDLEAEQLYEEAGGIEETLKKLFTENGFEITEDLAAETENLEENLEENFDEKLDNILDQLKKEGIVD